MVFGLSRTPSQAHPFAPCQQRLAETDGELLDLYVGPLGGQEVAQLVEEDDEAESECDQKNTENGREHEVSYEPCLNEPGATPPTRYYTTAASWVWIKFSTVLRAQRSAASRSSSE